MKNVFLYCTWIFSSSRMPRVYKCMLRTCTIWALCTVNVNVLSRILRTCTAWILCTVYNVHCIVQYCVQCSWTYCLECRVFEMVLVPPMDLYRGQRKYRLYRFYCYIVVSSRDCSLIYWTIRNTTISPWGLNSPSCLGYQHQF